MVGKSRTVEDAMVYCRG